MAHAGQIIDNPVSGERIAFLRTAADTGGALLEFELELAADGRVRRHERAGAGARPALRRPHQAAACPWVSGSTPARRRPSPAISTPTGRANS